MKKVLKFSKLEITWEDALQEFMYWKQAQGLAEKTLDDYNCHVKRFFSRYPDTWQSDKMRKSALEYMANKIAPATYNLRLIYLRAFFQWCLRYLLINPLHDFKRKKAPGRIVDIAEDNLRKLLTLPDLGTFAGLRDYALMIFTLDTGIRPGEAASLVMTDFDLMHLLVIVPRKSAKTRTERTLPILPVTAEAIRRLIKVRPAEWQKEIPVFCSSEGRAMSRYIWKDRMALYSHKLGVKIRPYDLRHAFAIIYLRNGGHAFGLQKTLGHTDIQMTRRYVNMTGQDLRESHIKASPLNTLIDNKSRRIRKLK